MFVEAPPRVAGLAAPQRALAAQACSASLRSGLFFDLP